MITVVGSLLMDLAVRVPRLVRPGEVVHGHAAQYACGGRGANQACAVVRLGGRAGLIGVVGDDIAGAALLSAVKQAGVDARGVMRRAGAASGCFIVAADPDGVTQVVVANGVNATLSAGDVEQYTGMIASSQALLAQLETSAEAVETALRIARSAGVRTLLNAAPAFRCSAGLLPLCDVITVNEQEAGQLAGIAVCDTDSAAQAASAIKRRGAGNVFVTLGAAGAWVDASSWCGHIPGHAVPVVDTFGAGDTFAGALAVRLCEGAAERAAAEFAVAASALSVMRPGAQPAIPQRREVEDFLAAGASMRGRTTKQSRSSSS